MTTQATATAATPTTSAAPTATPAQAAPATSDVGKVLPQAAADQAAPEVAATPAAAPKAEPAPADDKNDLSKQLGVLARKEKQIQEREKGIKAKETEFKKYEEAKARGPLAILQAAGFSMDDAVKVALETQNKDPNILTLEEQLRQIQEERNRDKQSAEQQAIDRAVAGFKTQIKGVVEADPDKFELIHAEGEVARDLIFDVCEAYYAEHKQLLDPVKAAEQVEATLEEQYKARTKYKKLQKLFAPAPTEAPKAETTEAAAAPAQKVATVTATPAPDSSVPNKTLTNKATPTAGPSAGAKVLPREQAIKQIAAQFRKAN